MVVPSRDRPTRLRWLLNALEEQTLERERFEVVVAHDSRDGETEELLRRHPLAHAGVLRHITFPPGFTTPAGNRNAAWRAARAPLIAFTDDDCRPPADWLRRALEAGRRNSGAIVQGRTEPDPDEWYLRSAAPHDTTQVIDPPDPWAQTCNIAYPRSVLERFGGFHERFRYPCGEDTDLGFRARRGGTPYVGAPEMLTYHAVDAVSLAGRFRGSWRWQDIAYLTKRQPGIRRHFYLLVFWKWTHAWFALALAGGLLARRNPLLGLLALPWAIRRRPHYGRSLRGGLRAAAELPGRALIDLAEIAALLRGSVKYRTLVL